MGTNAKAVGEGNGSPVTRASLLVRIKDPRDNHAWNQFAEVYLPMVHRYCLRRGLQDADATDASQDVMNAVSRAVAKFEYDPAHGSFRDWLFVVVRSKLNNFFHKQARRERGTGRTSMQQILSAQPAAEETIQWDDDCRRQLFEWAAKRARAEFKDSTWKAFYMSAVEAKPTGEITRATGLSAGAIYIAKSRVLARLRQLVAELGDASSRI
jgi:RNA polymerase sigma factor (sigma-70 family)